MIFAGIAGQLNVAVRAPPATKADITSTHGRYYMLEDGANKWIGDDS